MNFQFMQRYIFFSWNIFLALAKNNIIKIDIVSEFEVDVYPLINQALQSQVEPYF